MAKNDYQETYLSRNIKMLEKKYGLTHQMLADKAEISVDTIKTICRRTNTKNYIPTVDVLIRIASFFQLKTYEMLFHPSIDMLAMDIEIAGELSGMNQKEEQTNQQKFRQAMIEKGFNSVAVMIDYIMFSGYDITFLYSDTSYNKTKIENAREEFLEKNYDIEEIERETLCIRVNKARELTKIQNELQSEENEKKREEIIVRLEAVSKEYFEAVQENLDARHNKKSFNNVKKYVNQKVGMEEILELVNTLDLLPTRVCEKKLEELNVDVVLQESGETYKKKNIKFSEFYKMCLSAEKYISNMIDQGLPV